jgi:hypothetical protein
MKEMTVRCGDERSSMPCGDGPAKRGRNDTRPSYLLPERALEINQIHTLWAVLARWAQWNQHGCHSKRREMRELGRIMVFCCLVGRPV